MLHTAIDLDLEPSAPAGHDIFGTIDVAAHGFEQIIIGVYEAIIPEPHLHARVEPDLGDLVTISQNRVDENGDYTLICNIQNYSNQPCRVTISAAKGNRQ